MAKKSKSNKKKSNKKQNNERLVESMNLIAIIAGGVATGVVAVLSADQGIKNQKTNKVIKNTAKEVESIQKGFLGIKRKMK